MLIIHQELSSLGPLYRNVSKQRITLNEKKLTTSRLDLYDITYLYVDSQIPFQNSARNVKQFCEGAVNRVLMISNIGLDRHVSCFRYDSSREKRAF